MQTASDTPSVVSTTAAPPAIPADLIVIPVFDDDTLADVQGLDAASGGEIAAARARGEFAGKAFDLFITGVQGWRAGRVVLIGAGARKEFSADRLRRIATAAGLAARQRRCAKIAILHRPGTGLTSQMAAQMLAEGAVLANFNGASYKTTEPPPGYLDSVVIRVDGDQAAVPGGLERGRVLGECTNLARTLANEPGNAMTPRAFAVRAEALARAAGLAVEVLDETRIAQMKMGLLMGVAQGSQEPPRMVVLRHEPRQAPQGALLALVGKGVTFDTGGISIKPAELMDRMKDDMSGGAAVLCAMIALARLGAPVRCIGVIPLAENMPGGRAFKPGDVLTSAEGKTVEILNTDAEGRLVLGDALWYARQQGATHLVDVATLTGACVVALGKTTSGLFGRPDAWRDRVLRASERAGDRSWPMPIFEDYKELFKSEIADFANTGGRAGGAITGALFVEQFSGGLPWVHLDIAGTAWVEDAKPYQAKGASGVAVRTLAELALDDGWNG